MWMQTFVLLKVAFFTAVLADATSTGRKLATEKQFPHQVALITPSKWCGGALISKDWVLTSGQCIEGTEPITVILGAHNIAINEDTQVRLEVPRENVHLHEDILLNDIAAVMLPVSVEFSDYIKTVTLPRVSYAEVTFEGFDAITSGWSYARSSELLYGSVNIGKGSDCSGYFQDGEIDTSIVCVNTVDDTCHGDLGNPLTLQDVSKTLIGLASLGWSSDCFVGQPALFTRITSYTRWIYETTGVINNRF